MYDLKKNGSIKKKIQTRHTNNNHIRKHPLYHPLFHARPRFFLLEHYI